MVRQRVFFDFSISDERAGRVVFELFSDIVPKTCENFRALATGEMGLSQLSGQPLHYKNSIIHRSIPDFMVQGGDFTKRNGKGGESIYGAPFEDEDLSTDMDAEGLLCMANKGPNTNGSQWFVTLRPCPHLNGKHVVFGKVVHGFDVIVKISKLPVDEKDRPLMPVVIFHSGELELRKPAPKPSAQALSESVSSTEDAISKRKRRHSDVKAASEEDEEDRDRRRPTKVDEEDSEDGRRSKKHSSKRKDKDRHRSSKKKHHKDRSQSRGDGAPENNVKDQTAPKEPQEETEEELDLRLEREEKERLQQAKLRELEELRKRPAVGPAASGGVNFKGRGRMKFRDPETSLRGW